MPIYEYGCLACGAHFEKFMQVATAVACPTCESDRVSRRLSVVGGRVGRLDRLGRGASVTKGGALLLGYAQRMLALSREARQAMESFQGRMSGDLLVGASTIPGEYILPALIGRFKEKFPDIAITLLIGGSQAVTEWVLEGRAEVGVVGARSGHRAIAYRELLPDDIVLIVGATHPWQGRPLVTLHRLRAKPLLLRAQGSGTRAALESALATAGTDIGAFRVVGGVGSTQARTQAGRA